MRLTESGIGHHLDGRPVALDAPDAFEMDAWSSRECVAYARTSHADAMRARRFARRAV
jgi:hypothetical protein